MVSFSVLMLQEKKKEREEKIQTICYVLFKTTHESSFHCFIMISTSVFIYMLINVL